MAGLDLKLEIVENREARNFARINRSINARVAARATNETLIWARSQAIKQTAKALKLPQKYIRNRYDRGGQKKAERAVLVRSNRVKLEGKLIVYMRGLPVFQVSGAQTRPRRGGGGVKAKGSRFYQGAFYAQGLVFKRRSNSTQLMLPKIGVRKRLSAEFEELLLSPRAYREFDRRWQRLMKSELKRTFL